MATDLSNGTVNDILSDPVAVDLLEKQPLMRLAYTGIDGAPRVIPVGYLVRDGQIIFCTVPSSAKVDALRNDPRVAITIDVGQPPCCLLLRGTAEIEIVPGVPDDYLESSLRGIPVEAHQQFEAQVRQLYDEMARIVITPAWARLLDFQRTAPRAVERLVAAKTSG